MTVQADSDSVRALPGIRVPRQQQTPPAQGRVLRRLESTTRSFRVGEGEGYLTVGRDTEGSVVEVHVRMSKQGSTLSGLVDALSATLTKGLRGGVPLETFVREYVSTRFDPSGPTDDPEIRQATSVLDYIGRRLALDHLPYEVRSGIGVLSTDERLARAGVGVAPPPGGARPLRPIGV